MNKLYVILKKYLSLNMTIICLRYGKTAKYGGEFDQDDCFTSKKAAVDAINHFERIGSSARYRVVEASSVGTVNITDREICIGRGLASISPVCKMTSLFAYYWISTLQGDFIKKATGSTFIAITADTVKEQLVPIPPLAEQLKIVDIIECLYKQSNAILESL